VVQSADWKFGATNTGKQPKYVKDAALATFVLCILGLVGYTVYSVCDGIKLKKTLLSIFLISLS